MRSLIIRKLFWDIYFQWMLRRWSMWRRYSSSITLHQSTMTSNSHRFIAMVNSPSQPEKIAMASHCNYRKWNQAAMAIIYCNRKCNRSRLTFEAIYNTCTFRNRQSFNNWNLISRSLFLEDLTIENNPSQFCTNWKAITEQKFSICSTLDNRNLTQCSELVKWVDSTINWE